MRLRFAYDKQETVVSVCGGQREEIEYVDFLGMSMSGSYHEELEIPFTKFR